MPTIESEVQGLVIKALTKALLRGNPQISIEQANDGLMIEIPIMLDNRVGEQTEEFISVECKVTLL